MRTRAAPKVIVAGARVLGKNALLFLVGMWALGTLAFLFVVLSGRDLETVYTSGLPPGAREEAKRALTLNQPSVLSTYGAYWAHFLTGRWGFSSIYYPRTVIELLGERLPRSLLLLGLSLFAALGVSRILSQLMDHRRSGLAVASRFGTLALATLPLPLAVLLPAHGLVYRLGWVPFGQTLDPMLWRNHPDANLNGVLLGLAAAFTLGLIAGACVLAWAKRKLPSPWAVLLGGGAFALGGTLALIAIQGEGLPLGLDLLRHLVLPGLTLTLYAGAWHALLLRSDFLPRRFGVEGEKSSAREESLGPWAVYLSLVLALLPAVEASYHWLGLGPLLNRALLAADLPLLQGLSFVLVGLLALGVLARKTVQDLRFLRSSDSLFAHVEDVGGSSRRRYLRTAYRIGLLGLLVFVLAAVVHPLLLETVWDPKIYDPRQGTDPRLPAPAPPSPEHPLGTDRGGRDVLSGLMSWMRSTLFSSVPQGMGAALLGLGFVATLRLLARGDQRAPLRLTARGLALLGYTPLALPLLFVGLTAVVRWPLPFWTWWALLGLPWAFHVLRSPMRSGGPARYGALLGAAICYGTGAILLRLTLQLPRGVSLEPWLIQAPFREGWLFWPEILTRWLLPFLVFSLGWALLLWAREVPSAARQAPQMQPPPLDFEKTRANVTALSPKAVSVPRGGGGRRSGSFTL